MFLLTQFSHNTVSYRNQNVCYEGTRCSLCELPHVLVSSAPLAQKGSRNFCRPNFIPSWKLRWSVHIWIIWPWNKIWVKRTMWTPRVYGVTSQTLQEHRNFAVCVKEVYLIEPPKLILKPLLRPLHKEQVRTDITSLFVVEWEVASMFLIIKPQLKINTCLQTLRLLYLIISM